MDFSKRAYAYENRLNGYRLMPWFSWEEWNLIRESLFSSSAESVVLATSRIAVWRNKWNLPELIDITSSFIQIQQRDPYFRKDLTKDELIPDNLLSTLYCMEIVRLVNAVVEKIRNTSQASMWEVAIKIGLPRMLIDIRHESSHRGLPSIQLARDASILAVGWLKSYYWDPQREIMLTHRYGNPTTREEIIYKLKEVVSVMRRRRGPFIPNGMIDNDLPHGGGKPFSILVCGKRKMHSSLSVRSKKRLTKAVRSLVQLHRFFPSEVVSVFLDLLMPGRHCPFSEIDTGTCHFRDSGIQWKPVVSKLSKWVPQLIPELISTVLDHVLQRQKASRAQPVVRRGGVTGPESKLLMALFTWLVEGKVASPSILRRLLRECLLCAYDDVGGGQLLAGFAELVAGETGDASLVSGVEKLTTILAGDWDDGSLSDSGEGEALYRAGEKLCWPKNRGEGGGGTEKKRWRLSKGWAACPIGMLPGLAGLSPHRLPILGPGLCVVVSDGESSKPAVAEKKRKLFG